MEPNNVDLSTIELSFTQKLTLLFLPSLGFLPIFNQTTIEDLKTLNLIKRNRYHFNGMRKYKRSAYGKMYFRYKRKDRFRFLLPLVISIIALLAAYDVLYIKWLAELLSRLGRLLNPIVEGLGI